VKNVLSVIDVLLVKARVPGLAFFHSWDMGTIFYVKKALSKCVPN
jgi:hypothetical protein